MGESARWPIGFSDVRSARCTLRIPKRAQSSGTTFGYCLRSRNFRQVVAGSHVPTVKRPRCFSDFTLRTRQHEPMFKVTTLLSVWAPQGPRWSRARMSTPEPKRASLTERIPDAADDLDWLFVFATGSDCHGRDQGQPKDSRTRRIVFL